jgi:hypothetical protein
VKYAVFTYSGDEITSGGAPHDFGGPLESEQEVIMGTSSGSSITWTETPIHLLSGCAR